MNLEQLKNHIESFPADYQFKYGLSKPFSWRGSYDEVAFAIVGSMSKEEVLENINLAYTETFYGYKGGEYKYGDWTDVNFEEEGSRNYSGGGYTSRKIAELEESDEYINQEQRLVKLAFR